MPEHRPLPPPADACADGCPTKPLRRGRILDRLPDDVALDLADSTRVKIIVALMGDEGCVCDIVRLRQNPVSHQLLQGGVHCVLGAL